MKTGTVRAYKTGYAVDNYVLTHLPVIDGNWTYPEEWVDAEEKQLDGSLNAIFRLKYFTDTLTYATQYYLIEFFDDTTNDAGDYWQICCAAATDWDETPLGGTTPKSDCSRWDFVGHNATGLTIYRGDGTTWVDVTSGYLWPSDIEIVDTISASPLDSNPHWIVEIKIQHLAFGIYPEFWIRMAAYDESNAGAGVQAWPAGSVDVPDDWGLTYFIEEVIPEVLTIGVMVILLSVSVLIVPHYFRKWLRNESCNARKTEK